MFDMIPFSSRSYTPSTIWDPFQEFFGTVAHAAATDIREDDHQFVIETELPGFDKSELAVNMKEGVLTVRAEHQSRDEDKSDNGYIRRERTSAAVERRFEVSGVDAAAIKAEYVNGVLKLTLPKLPEVVPEQHQIQIQ